MPQDKAYWLLANGYGIDERFARAVFDYLNHGTRPAGPLDVEGAVAIPLLVLTDPRLPPAAVRVFGIMVGLVAHADDDDGPPVVGVHDRVLEAALGVSRDVVRNARQALEKHGYIRRREGSSTPGDWHAGYRGHWDGKNRPPRYELVGLELAGRPQGKGMGNAPLP